MLAKHGNVARVESLRFVEVAFALLPLASPALEICHGFRNPAAIGKKRTCLLKVTQRRIVILQTGVVVITLCKDCFAQSGLESKRGFGCLPRLFTQGNCRL